MRIPKCRYFFAKLIVGDTKSYYGNFKQGFIDKAIGQQNSIFF